MTETNPNTNAPSVTTVKTIYARIVLMLLAANLLFTGYVVNSLYKKQEALTEGQYQQSTEASSTTTPQPPPQTEASSAENNSVPTVSTRKTTERSK
tara:strand:- start:54 stop:341 length:288 start_codon:yes stop_codon:yes gene_type:complete